MAPVNFKAPEDQQVWYNGSCHCHAVEFKVNHCNCSICTKSGYLLIYPPRKNVVFTKGWDHLKDYRFATNTRDHKFCPTCGSSVCIDFLGILGPEDVLGMSARLLQDVDLDKLAYRTFDGRNKLNAEFNDKF